MIWRLLDRVGGVGRYCDRVFFCEENKRALDVLLTFLLCLELYMYKNTCIIIWTY